MHVCRWPKRRVSVCHSVNEMEAERELLFGFGRNTIILLISPHLSVIAVFLWSKLHLLSYIAPHTDLEAVIQAFDLFKQNHSHCLHIT